MQDDENKKRKYYWAIILSLVFHLVILSLSFKDKALTKRPKKKQIKVVKIKLPKPKKAVKKPKELEDKKRKQIVNNELKGKREKTKTRFLGAKDQKYDRQTTARKIGVFKKAGKGKRNASKKRAATKRQVAKKTTRRRKKLIRKKRSLNKLADIGFGSFQKTSLNSKLKKSKLSQVRLWV